jgi:hypothetical protein
MFMAGDRKEVRAYKIRRYLNSEPGISLLLAAVNFEWTIGRAVLFLSKRPNSNLRALMRKYYSLDAYKELWKIEIAKPRECELLTDIVRNWSTVRKAFETRNLLVHGRDNVTRNMAMPHVEALIKGANYVDEYCETLGYPLSGRMPVRLK